MKFKSLDKRMRALEIFHCLKAPPESWLILRIVGRSFSKMTEDRFEKPFDLTFHDHMVETARALLVEFQGRYGYTESDEISILLPPTWDLFDREVEKIVSVSASIAGATFSLRIQEPVQFDSRIWVGPGEEVLVDYFRWRQADASRCALNGWTYWALRKSGIEARSATERMEGMSVGDKNELLFQLGINFNDVPQWQRRGTGLFFETHEKEGMDPRSGRTTVTTRRRVHVDEELPMKDGYGEYLEALIRKGR